MPAAAQQPPSTPLSVASSGLSSAEVAEIDAAIGTVAVLLLLIIAAFLIIRYRQKAREDSLLMGREHLSHQPDSLRMIGMRPPPPDEVDQHAKHHEKSENVEDAQYI